MTSSLRPRLVRVDIDDAAFLLRFNLEGTEAQAITHAVTAFWDRWSMDVIAARIATAEDLAELGDEITDLDLDV